MDLVEVPLFCLTVIDVACIRPFVCCRLMMVYAESSSLCVYVTKLCSTFLTMSFKVFFFLCISTLALYFSISVFYIVDIFRTIFFNDHILSFITGWVECVARFRFCCLFLSVVYEVYAESAADLYLLV